MKTPNFRLLLTLYRLHGLPCQPRLHTMSLQCPRDRVYPCLSFVTTMTPHGPLTMHLYKFVALFILLLRDYWPWGHVKCVLANHIQPRFKWVFHSLVNVRVIFALCVGQKSSFIKLRWLILLVNFCQNSRKRSGWNFVQWDWHLECFFY